jgi:hypothetical protein
MKAKTVYFILGGVALLATTGIVFGVVRSKARKRRANLFLAELENVSSDTPVLNQYFFGGQQLTGRLLSPEMAVSLAQQVWDANGWHKRNLLGVFGFIPGNDDEDKIYGALRTVASQEQISQVADAYRNLPVNTSRTSMVADLSEIFDTSELQELLKIALSKPVRI